MIKYSKLFEVKFYHQYYENYSVKDLVVQPSPGCQTLLKSYGVLFKQTNEGFVLLYNEEKENLLKTLKEEITFQFGVKVKNKYFETFSNVISTKESAKYYFENSPENIAKTSDDDQIKLHTDSFVNENNVCLCSHESLVLKELLGPGDVLLKQNEETLVEGILENWQTASSVFMRNYGKYQVTTDSVEKELLYIPAWFAQTFAIIDLAIGGENSGFDQVKGSEYQIWFENRSVQWNYYFVSDSDKFYDEINLFSGREKLPFSKPEQVSLINGQQAQKVTSQELYPLKQRYNDLQVHAEFVNDSSGEFGNKKLNLGTPDISRIKGKREKDSEIYFSEMYIYL